MPDPDLTDTILKLSDPDAIDLLRRLAEGVGAALPSQDDGDAAMELAREEPSAAPNDGSAARLALCLLAEGPRYAGPVRAMLANPPAQRMALDPFTATLLTSGLLLALQTHVEFVRKTDGTWSLKVIKKPTKDGLLGPLIKKLAALLK